MTDQTSRLRIFPLFVAYYLTIAAWFIGALLPRYRLWAFNWWAYLDPSLQVTALVVLIILPAVIWYVAISSPKHVEPSADHTFPKIWWRLVGIVVLALGVLFWLLRTEIHFLGDGYTLMANLSEGHPVLKLRDFGEAAIHLWLSGILPGAPDSAALFSYRIVSIGAGMLFLLTVAWFCQLLFESLRQRLLFLVALGSGGYSLLFFGYVENYALFVSSTVITCLTGIAIARRLLSRWWILLPFALSCVFHVGGIALLPAVLYAVFLHTSVARAISGWTRKTRVILVTLLVAGVTGTAVYLYLTKLAFRLMVVPLWPDRFEVGGYTMFSFAHLFDFVNLLFVLIPGLLVVAAFFFRSRHERSSMTPPTAFLLIATICCTAAAFAFDPKLGMARDWDLLSFGIAPLFVLLIYSLVTAAGTTSRAQVAVILLLALNFGTLLPRALAIHTPRVGLQHIENYLALDRVRSRSTMGILYDYYDRTNQPDKARDVKARLRSWYPETALNDSGLSLYASGRVKESLSMFHRASEHDPCNFSAYANVGMALLALKQFDSALTYLEIAYAMNSYNAPMLSNLASVYYFKGRIHDAQKLWERSLQFDSTVLPAAFGLSKIYANQGKKAESQRLFIRAAKSADAPGFYITQLGDMMTVRGDFTQAAEAYHRALAAGLDSAYVWNVISKYPALQRAMGW